jgi:drug/metabolite transporter (DMT)-like permease
VTLLRSTPSKLSHVDLPMEKTSSQPLRLRADLVLLLVAALWGSAFVAQRIAAEGGSVYFFNAARFLIAALLLLAVRRNTRAGTGQVFWMCAAGTVLFIASALQQAGLLTTSASNAGFLTSLYVVVVPFVVFVGWRQKPHSRAVAAVILAAAGAYLLSTAGEFVFRAGDALELGGAAFWALHVVLLGKFATPYDAVSFSAGQMLVASALNWFAGALFEPAPWPPTDPLIASIIYTAIVSLALGYTLQIWGQKHTPPTDAAIILSMESVFAAISGVIILGESLLPLQIAGCVLITVAAILAQARPWSTMKSTTPAADASYSDGDK